MATLDLTNPPALFPHGSGIPMSIHLLKTPSSSTVATKQKPNHDPAHVVFIGGTISGLAQVVVGYPFDSVKVLMQTSSSSSSSSALQVLSSTLKTNGLGGLFRGVTSPMAGVGYCNAVLFTTQSKLNGAIAPESTAASKYAMTGALSGLCISLLSSPLELVKVRMQASSANGTARYASTWACFTSTLRTEGIRQGLYRGWTITALRDVPSFAAYFATYEYLTRQRDVSSFVAGGLAGIACWIPCYPQDVLKSSVQTTTAARHGSVASVIRSWVKHAVAHGGNTAVVKGLWRGIAPTLVRAFPANAATFVVFEAYRERFARLA